MTKEIVLLTVALDWETGEIDRDAPFMVNSSRLGTLYNRPYENELEVIAQFRPGEWRARFEAEWDDETENWIFRQACRRRVSGGPDRGGLTLGGRSGPPAFQMEEGRHFRCIAVGPAGFELSQSRRCAARFAL
jgi:hypothetical protein